jgi:hypothetical protein
MLGGRQKLKEKLVNKETERGEDEVNLILFNFLGIYFYQRAEKINPANRNPSNP